MPSESELGTCGCFKFYRLIIPIYCAFIRELDWRFLLARPKGGSYSHTKNCLEVTF